MYRMRNKLAALVKADGCSNISEFKMRGGVGGGGCSPSALASYAFRGQRTGISYQAPFPKASN